MAACGSRDRVLPEPSLLPTPPPPAERDFAPSNDLYDTMAAVSTTLQAQLPATEAGPSSIFAFMDSVRARMRKDPGRQDLKDRIYYDGFMFLEEYLEDVMEGPSGLYVAISPFQGTIR